MTSLIVPAAMSPGDSHATPMPRHFMDTKQLGPTHGHDHEQGGGTLIPSFPLDYSQVQVLLLTLLSDS